MSDVIHRSQLADLIEHHVSLFTTALRGPEGTTVAQPSAPKLSGPGPEAAGAATRPSAPPSSPSGGTWVKVDELEGQSYTWPGPDGTETYDPFEVWETTDARGRVQIGLGRATNRGIYYGKERGYWLAFEMVNGQKRRPIVVFNEADDYDTSGALVGIIKGNGPGGRSMFKPEDTLPAGYEQLPVEVFRDRINGPQAFGRQAVVAEGGDRQVMLTHALLQLGLRS